MEEIIVTGKAPSGGGYGWWLRQPGAGGTSPGGASYFEQQRSATGSSQNIPANIGLSGLPAPALPFPVAPPPPPAAAPPPIPPGGAKIIPFPEIVVKGKRPQPVAPTLPRIPTWLRAGNIAIALAQVGTMWSDYASQRRLDEAAAGLLMPFTGKPDTPLRTIPEPEPIPEIVVTASRADQLRAGLVVPPIPQFWPSPTPEMFPGTGVPLTVPLPGMTPIEIPTPAPVPAATPAATPGLRPALIPQQIPMPFPGSRVVTSPQPVAAPAPAPAPAPLTPFSPGVAGLPGLTTVPVPQPQPQPDPARKCKPCPKCKKEKDKKRKKCYKKFVEERRFKRWDREIEWERIDCDTGRPI